MSALVYTPEEMLASADALEAEFERMVGDVEGSAVDDAFKAQWRAFADQWGAFYKSLRGLSGYFDRLWGATQDQIDQYRTQLVAWQKRFREAGGTTTGPDVAAADAGFDLSSAITWVVVGAIVIAGVVLYVRVSR